MVTEIERAAATRSTPAMATISLDELIALATDYADLGESVREQGFAVLFDGAALEDMNPNAIALYTRWLRAVLASGAVEASAVQAAIDELEER